MNKINYYIMLLACLTLPALLATDGAAKLVQIDCEVVRADGKPAADVGIYVSCTNPRAIEDPVLATGHTDANGIFHSQCDKLGDGNVFGVQVLAVAPDKQVGMALVNLITSTGQPHAIKITLGPSADANVRILQPDGQPVANLEVWVADYSGKPVRGERLPRFGNISKLPGDLWKATTDQDGRCVIKQLPLDTAIYLQHADSRFAQPYDKYKLYAASLPKNDGAEHKITLTKPGSMSGRVLDGNNVPVAGVLVSIIETSPYKTAYGADVRTKADGSFMLTQIPPSSYTLRLKLSPPLSDEWIGSDSHISVREGQTADAGDIHLQRVALVTAEVLDEDTGKKVEEPLTFRLPAGSHTVNYRMQRVPPKEYHVSGSHLKIPVTVKSGERKTVQFKLQPVKPSDMVTGHVLTPEGTPAANISVMLTTEHSWSRPEPVKTSKEGSFAILVPAEAKGVAAIAWDGARSMSEITPAKRGQSVTIQLKRDGFARVEGRVTDQSGFPIQGACVRWTDWSLRVSLMDNFDDIPDLVPETADTDADGRYVIPRLWTTLKPFITCNADGYNREELREVKLLPNQTKQLSFTLIQPGHIVKGTVVDSSGRPVEGANVRYSGDNQPGVHNNTKTDDHGAFQVGPLVAGNVYISASQVTPDFSREIDQFITVPLNYLRLVLPDADGAVTGVVLDHSNKPVANAEVSADLLRRKTNTDPQGRFKLTGLVQGWFTLHVSSQDSQGQELQRRKRVKTGSADIALQLPESPPALRSLPEKPLNLLHQKAPPLQTIAWIHSPALKPQPVNKVRIIDFWGLQCGPCLAALPKVAAFWKEHQQENLEIIAHCRYSPEEVTEFLSKHPDYTFPISIGSEDSSTWQDYDIRGVPTYVVIDRTGKIISYGHDWQPAALAALAALKK